MKRRIYKKLFMSNSLIEANRDVVVVNGAMKQGQTGSSSGSEHPPARGL
jgi:hypothetical protein